MSDISSDSNEVVIQIERKRHDAEHWIRPAPRTGNTEQQYRVLFDGQEIGSWRYPEGAAARWLLANGKAKRTDTLRTFHDGMFCLRGSVGWFADHTISETDKGGLRVVKWRAMPEGLKIMSGGESGPSSEPSEVE
jgi:hypothetical protein